MADWVIFGCGYVGTRLVKALLADGERVVACTRRKDKLAALEALGAQTHILEASRPRAFSEALAGHRLPVVVYSIPPIPDLPGGDPVRRAANASQQAGAQRFIFLSSTAVYGETIDGTIVDEESPTSFSDPDARPRIVEETAVDTARASGINTIVLRLSAIYGPGRGVRERLRTGSYQLIDDGSHVYSRIHVDDLVAIMRVAAARAASGSIYCLSDDRPCTQKEYSDWLSDHLGLPRAPSVPSLAPGVKRRPVRNRHVANAKLKRDFDYTFRYPTYVEGELSIDAEEGITPDAAAAAASRVAVAVPATVQPHTLKEAAVEDPTETAVTRPIAPLAVSPEVSGPASGPAVVPVAVPVAVPAAPPSATSSTVRRAADLRGELSRGLGLARLHVVAESLAPGGRSSASDGELLAIVVEGAPLLQSGSARDRLAVGDVAALGPGAFLVNDSGGPARVLLVRGH